MSKYERYAIAFSIGAGVIGLVTAIGLREGHYFARSGAVIATIAVIFGSLEIRKRLANAIGFIEEGLIKQRSKTLAMCVEQGLDAQRSAAIVEQVEFEVRAEAKSEIEKVTKRMLRIEVGILIVGTIIWGFGDMPLDHAFANNAMHATCDTRVMADVRRADRTRGPSARCFPQSFIAPEQL